MAMRVCMDVLSAWLQATGNKPQTHISTAVTRFVHKWFGFWTVIDLEADHQEDGLMTSLIGAAADWRPTETYGGKSSATTAHIDH